MSLVEVEVEVEGKFVKLILTKMVVTVQSGAERKT